MVLYVYDDAVMNKQSDIDGVSSQAQPADSVNLAVSRWLRSFVAALAMGIVLSVYVIVVKLMASDSFKLDFLTFYLSGVRLQHAQPVYWPAPAREEKEAACKLKQERMVPYLASTRDSVVLARLEPCRHPNLNPPFAMVLLKPLSYLDYTTARLSWFGVSVLAGVFSLVLLCREGLLPRFQAVGGIALAAAYFGYFPMFINLLYGQVTTLILLQLMLGWLALRRDRPWVAGFWLGLAASLKPFVAVFGLGFAMQRNWRAAAAMLVMGLACLGIGGAVTGFDAYPAYRAVLGDVNWQAASWNASLSGFFYRIFGGSENEPWIQAPQIGFALTVIASLAVLSSYWLVLHRSRHSPRDARADTLFALSIPTMLLLSPLGWSYYFPLLIAPIAVLWREYRRHTMGWKFSMLLLALALALSAVPGWLIRSKDMNTPVQWFGSGAVPFYALLLVYILVVLRSTRADPSVPGMRQDL